MEGKVKHYLYFASSATAAAVADELEKRGYQAEYRQGALGDSWLVLAYTSADPAASRSTLEDIAESFQGEYDGWEAAV